MYIYIYIYMYMYIYVCINFASHLKIDISENFLKQ